MGASQDVRSLWIPENVVVSIEYAVEDVWEPAEVYRASAPQLRKATLHLLISDVVFWIPVSFEPLGSNL